MKKLTAFIALIALSIILVGCQTTETVTLPDFTGYNQEAMKEVMDELELETTFIIRARTVREQSNMFIEYGQNYQVGDNVEQGTFVPIIVSATLFDDQEFYQIQELGYTGPRLDETMVNNPWYLENGNYVAGVDQARTEYHGGGGVFEVTLNRCIDGDTTVFNYPEEISSRILSRTPSVRYLNLDTPETWSGGEEPFGYMASLYVCDLLTNAEAIYLQTDPGDYLLGNHGRLLSWIWINLPGDDELQLLNYLIVQQGLGEVAYLFGAGETEVTMYDGKTYTEWMYVAEAEAIEAERGLFSDELIDFYWDYEQNRPYPGRWGN